MQNHPSLPESYDHVPGIPEPELMTKLAGEAFWVGCFGIAPDH